jgi:hypothetical protein
MLSGPMRGREFWVAKIAEYERSELTQDGPLDVGFGSDASTLVDTASTPGHQRMLVRGSDGRWRTIIDEPHRILNGYAVSPDGAQVAVVALIPASTWCYLPFTSPPRR